MVSCYTSKVWSFLALLLLPFLGFTQTAEQVVQGHLDQLITQSPLQSGDISEFKISSDHVSSTSSVHHYYFEQATNGIRIWSSLSSYHEASGVGIKSHNKFFANLGSQIIDSPVPGISAIQAVERVAEQMAYTINPALSVMEAPTGPELKTVISKSGISLENITANLIYVPELGTVDQEGVQEYELNLAWEMIIQEPNQTAVYHFLVDASNGDILDKFNMVVECGFDNIEGNIEDHDHDYNHGHGHAHVHEVKVTVCNNDGTGMIGSMMMSGDYQVFAVPVESPGHGVRTIETNPDDPIASPFGWRDTDGVPGNEFTVTRGNNVHAYEDGDNPGYSPDGGMAGSFLFPFNPVYTTGRSI